MDHSVSALNARHYDNALLLGDPSASDLVRCTHKPVSFHFVEHFCNEMWPTMKQVPDMKSIPQNKSTDIDRPALPPFQALTHASLKQVATTTSVRVYDRFPCH